ncbi:hypothetical protein L596_007565 [Steinernema carpocapsae]|uniref:V-type proton ATPase subunit S1/VOA1 transmembrane domain-containing protein n=1 Tax=Steinernema carpocapsae TaxID=34508 RepID=A0A4U5P9Q2_STECR|nr:hypothetical protein L596_007565 [Steinernema carpocapsae]
MCVPESRYKVDAASVRGTYTFAISVKVDPAGVEVKTEGQEGTPLFTIVDTISFRLTFNTTMPRSWELVSVGLSEMSVEPAKGGEKFLDEKLKISSAQPIEKDPKLMRVYTADPYAFGCSDTQAVFFPVQGKKNYQLGLAFHNLQVQLYGLHREEEKNLLKFSRDVNDCVGTFSTGSGMGIFVAVILASIFFFAFAMLNSVQTMDRFDDPKQKQIVINVKE